LLEQQSVDNLRLAKGQQFKTGEESGRPVKGPLDLQKVNKLPD